jgi:cyclohexanone monooxygenase
VFQRTPNFSVPAQQRPARPEPWRPTGPPTVPSTARRRETPGFGFPAVDPASRRWRRRDEERRPRYEERWRVGGFASSGRLQRPDRRPEANDTAAEFVREKIREIVKDPARRPRS